MQTAEGLAEWLHWRVRNDLGIDVRQGRRYSWGYPAVPDQSEHLKVEKLLDLSQIGMAISDGYAPIPEQSTLALSATTRRPATTACATAACCPTARPTT